MDDNAGLSERKELYIWGVHPSSAEPDFHAHCIAPDELLQHDVTSLVSGFGRGVYVPRGAKDDSAEQIAAETEALANLHAMHAVLIEPIKGLLPPPSATCSASDSTAAQRLIFIQHDELCRVPFPALMGRAKDDNPLLAGYEVHVCNSLRVLKLTLDNATVVAPGPVATAQALVLGYPDVDLPAVQLPWAPEDAPVVMLPGAIAEAAAVAEILGVSALIGVAATSNNVLLRLRSASVVHIATHGFVNENGDQKVHLLLHDDDSGGRSSSAFLSESELDPKTMLLSARLGAAGMPLRPWRRPLDRGGAGRAWAGILGMWSTNSGAAAVVAAG